MRRSWRSSFKCEFSRGWLSGTPPQFRERKKTSSSRVYVFHKTPHKDVVMQWRQRNVSNSVLDVQVVILLNKAKSIQIRIFFNTFVFYTNQPSVYTKPVNPDAETALLNPLTARVIMAFCKVALTLKSVDEILWSQWLFNWNLSACTFTWCCLFSM